jgi:hypothetical protein
MVMDIEIGSNVYRNTDGTIEIEGVPQLEVSLRSPGGPLRVSFIVFDQNGKIVAKVVDSTMAFNEQRAFELTKSATGLTLTHSESRKVILELGVKADNRVVISKGEFRTMKGHQLEITSSEWSIDKKKQSSTDTDVLGKSVILG